MPKIEIVPASFAAGDHLAVGSIHVRGWQQAFPDMMPKAHLASLDIATRQELWRKRFETPEPTDCRCTLVARMTVGDDEDGTVNGSTEATTESTAETTTTTTSTKVIGWVGVDRSRDPGNTDGTDGEIWAIYVDPDHWRQRVGGLLLQEGLKWLKQDGFATCSLWVLEKNVKARGFYERNGFVLGNEESDRRVDNIGGADIDVMRYHLTL